MSKEIEAHNTLCDMQGFPRLKDHKQINIGETFILKGFGKAKVVNSKRGLTIEKV